MLVVTPAELNETRPLTSHWLDWFLNETNNCDLWSLKSTVWESSSAKNLILEFFFLVSSKELGLYHVSLAE